ncbi:hypothetical protein [Endozoicomonas sp. OPT23]|uniref:hypothetical protein n=1 Tax=Endozoicomonas sp. OPT23 TaxID=2072845 RepID=UPI00129B89B0|nr:hypothetical protein [Endozoicomonas sp. OPT23]
MKHYSLALLSLIAAAGCAPTQSEASQIFLLCEYKKVYIESEPQHLLIKYGTTPSHQDFQLFFSRPSTEKLEPVSIPDNHFISNFLINSQKTITGLCHRIPTVKVRYLISHYEESHPTNSIFSNEIQPGEVRYANFSWDTVSGKNYRQTLAIASLNLFVLAVPALSILGSVFDQLLHSRTNYFVSEPYPDMGVDEFRPMGMPIQNEIVSLRRLARD